LSPLFAAVTEATVEAVYNAIFKATTVSSARGELKAVPIERVKTILEKYNALHWGTNLESPNRGC